MGAPQRIPRPPIHLAYFCPAHPSQTSHGSESRLSRFCQRHSVEPRERGKYAWECTRCHQTLLRMADHHRRKWCWEDQPTCCQCHPMTLTHLICRRIHQSLHLLLSIRGHKDTPCPPGARKGHALSTARQPCVVEGQGKGGGERRVRERSRQESQRETEREVAIYARHINSSQLIIPKP